MARINNGPRIVAILVNGEARIHKCDDHTLTQARALYDSRS